jgi:hypothetical protein
MDLIIPGFRLYDMQVIFASEQNRASKKGSTVYHLIITDVPIAQGTLEHIDNAAEVWSLTGNTYVFVVLALKASPEIQSEATALSRVKLFIPNSRLQSFSASSITLTGLEDIEEPNGGCIVRPVEQCLLSDIFSYVTAHDPIQRASIKEALSPSIFKSCQQSVRRHRALRRILWSGYFYKEFQGKHFDRLCSDSAPHRLGGKRRSISRWTV